MRLKKKQLELKQYCRCEKPVIATKNGQFGYQEYCTKCGKDIEDGFHYYNHYDGQDHDDNN